MRVISSRDEIQDLNPNEKVVHMSFRPSNVDFLNLMKKCPRLRAIQVPPSYQRTMSNVMKGFLEMQGVDLLEGDVWGHRKDLDEYITIEDRTLNEIRYLISKGMGLDDVKEEIQKTTNINPELIMYIAERRIMV
ncbi:MAG: DUF1699 family protein [Methanotrichaceae archaeon]|nr:DUF1699 family protein [Methanotrichaceae archaeon]MDD1758539.1 DUF1699 family protein [Methanotrichaceae archaeon]